MSNHAIQISNSKVRDRAVLKNEVDDGGITCGSRYFQRTIECAVPMDGIFIKPSPISQQ